MTPVLWHYSYCSLDFFLFANKKSIFLECYSILVIQLTLKKVVRVFHHLSQLFLERKSIQV